ncbi:MAG TPA: Gfo/Idh/MocA family oxidoreductase [bacterium]|nr:Gfo/Idh/MocA family oxidoreductase [bacterium]
MQRYTRRDFLKGMAALSGGLALTPTLSAGRTAQRTLGANDTIRMAVVGFRGKGAQHIEILRDTPNVQVAALCDVDQAILDREAQTFREDNEPVDTYTDVRNVLDDDTIDAVVIATPNHWHALITVWACQAGKDVYVEKPVSHDIWEGQQMVAVARKYNRIVQSGTQLRSDGGLRRAFEYIREGNIGEIQLARTIHYSRRESIGKVTGPQAVPASVDYNLWTGPAHMQPLMRLQLHYDWHWDWTTGNGELGNNGVHRLDLCRWVMDEDALPRHVLSVGGRFGYDDDGETPNTHIIYYDYARNPVICEIRGLPTKKDSPVMDAYRDIRIGVVIHCEEGYFAGSGGGGIIYDNDGNRVESFEGDAGAGHHDNWIQAIRSRNRQELHAEIYDGHISSALCHLGNISHRSGSVASPDAIAERLDGDPAMTDAYDRFRAHLEANEVDLNATQATLGTWLNVNTSSEVQFSQPEENTNVLANALLKRDYREPFVLPEQV